ncbi:MAG: hypothetical protein IAE80_15905 [Anaerolinea sp.]|nr:hypothetical protein [Anaerolinea sp.]
MNTLQTFARLSRVLTRTHPSITDIEQRRQSKLLAGLMLTLMSLSLLASLLLILRDGLSPTVVAVWAADVITLILYVQNRRGHYRISALLFVALNFLLVHVGALATNDLSWLFFAGMMLIIAVILLPPLGAIAVYAASLFTQGVIGELAPLRSQITTFGTTLVFMITGALVLVFLFHRAGVERERRAELQAANRRLRDSEAALERRVAERTRELQIAKEEAEAARLHAEQADQIKSQFLAHMSHELRTPLNAILNFTEFITLEMVGPVNDRQKDLLTKSLESGRHLHALINDVLDITKIEAGMMALFLEPDVDLQALMKTVLDTTQTLLDGKPIKLVSDIDADLPFLIADSRRLKQTLLNLVSNAAKFTERGSITVSVKHRGEYVLFCISDTGIGIAPEEQQMIFEPFRQTAQGLRHVGAGTGLGLPISMWLINAHGGKLWLESEVGEGSSFYFTLPVKQLVSVNVPSLTSTY